MIVKSAKPGSTDFLVPEVPTSHFLFYAFFRVWPLLSV